MVTRREMVARGDDGLFSARPRRTKVIGHPLIAHLDSLVFPFSRGDQPNLANHARTISFRFSICDSRDVFAFAEGDTSNGKAFWQMTIVCVTLISLPIVMGVLDRYGPRK